MSETEEKNIDIRLGIEFDVNSLCTLNFGFDHLKVVIETLVNGFNK
jgi:hypothetical protein